MSRNSLLLFIITSQSFFTKRGYQGFAMIKEREKMLTLPFFTSRKNLASDHTILEVKTSRTGEETPEAMMHLLSSFTTLKKQYVPYSLWGGIPFSLELVVSDQTVKFYVTIPERFVAFLESQIIAHYPKALLTRVPDYLPTVVENNQTLSLGQIKLSHGYLYPIRVFTEFKDVDSLSSLLGLLSKSQPQDQVVLQFLLVPIGHAWQRSGERSIASKVKDATGVEHINPYSKSITQKISINGFKAAIRIAVSTESLQRSESLAQEIGNSFAAFNNPSGNSLVYRKVYLWQKKRLLQSILTRSRRFVPRQILNAQELATIYHFPTSKLATIHNISWHKTILSEPPEDLPVAEGKSPESKAMINFFAKTEYKNRMMTFGIKTEDRRKHMYVIGKTGTGKSTLIANLAISDMRNRRGLCVVDPHGDLCETLLDYVPSYRINDVVYLDPSDLGYAFLLNPLEVKDDYQRELVV